MKGQKVVVNSFQICTLVAAFSNYKMLHETTLVQGEQERSKVVDGERSGLFWGCDSRNTTKVLRKRIRGDMRITIVLLLLHLRIKISVSCMHKSYTHLQIPLWLVTTSILVNNFWIPTLFLYNCCLINSKLAFYRLAYAVNCEHIWKKITTNCWFFTSFCDLLTDFFL